jgi:hypothetical protein
MPIHIIKNGSRLLSINSPAKGRAVEFSYSGLALAEGISFTHAPSSHAQPRALNLTFIRKSNDGSERTSAVETGETLPAFITGEHEIQRQ